MRPLNSKSAPPLPRRRKRPVVRRGNLTWRSRLRVFARQWRWVGWLAGLIVLGIVGWYGSRHQWLASLSKTVDAVAWIAADPSYLAEILIAIFIVVVSLLVWLPKRQAARSQGASAENYFDRENEARKTLAQIIGGVLLLAGLYSSVRTFTLQERGQITDRYTKAIDQLGATTKDTDGKPKPNLEVRLGGIYALERITKDSPKDQWTIMEVLTAYVRQNAPFKPLRGKLPQCESMQGSVEAVEEPTVQEDIQAILKVLGRRDRDYDPRGRLLDLQNTDLSGAQLDDITHLEKAQLNGAHFKMAHLNGLHLSGAHLIGADLSGAHLIGADLSGANLSRANLSRVILNRAILIGANLRRAILNDGAFLVEADLRRADLSGADLVGAVLKKADLREAILIDADLSGAVLSEADLRGADLSRAYFNGAYFFEADLIGANLSGADLSEVFGLTRGQLVGTLGNGYTKLPSELERFRPASWSK